ncbi:nck-associated protein 5-like [Aplochiton taeniatus]
MRTMSDEMERRMCDEDFESDEGEEGEEVDVESYLGDVEEEENSSELMDRLKELEAENSALLLANESQREAYERCLDEVANHVVQALLNQKDLREECIKLKMLVFDLERQNRALCELFQQKLPNHPTSQYQVQPGPLPDYNAQLHNDSAKQVEPQPEAQAKGNGYRTQHPSPGPRGPAASMEALSPFFKKKAHILEVLRKMEETDPLKFHPSTAGLSFCDYSQVLMSTEAALAGGDLQAQHTHCRCSCCHGDTHQHVNGDGGHACKESPDGPSKCVTTATAAAAATASTAAISDCHAKSTGVEPSLPSKQGYNNGHPHPHQQKTCPDSRLSADDTASQSTGDGQVLKGSKVVKTELAVERDGVSAEGGGRCSSQTSVPEAVPCETETEEPEHNRAAPPHHAAMLDQVPEKDTAQDEAEGVRADASVSPGPGASCLSDVKAAAISSPSKLLKFLKIPSAGERSQAATSPVRLSPQLTRNSRIPCRTNNYEVYHSPVPSRRATTAERCRQPPPPPARSESYPATHSAPTSPPQSEDATSPPAKELGYSSLSSPISKACAGGVAKAASSSAASSSSPRSARRVPHYENVSEVSRREEGHGPEKRTTLPSQTKPGSGGERKLVKSLPESVLRPAPQRQLSSPSSSSSSSSSSDQEDRDSESPVWTDHHSLPSVSALHKAQGRAGSSRSRERPAQEAELRDSQPVSEAPPATQAPAPSRKNDPSSIPKRSGPGSGRSPAESSHHAFKERLAALGKLRGSEEAGGPPAGSADTPVGESGPKDERSKTVERTPESHSEEQRHSSKSSDSVDSKPKGNSGLKYPSQAHEVTAKPPPSIPGSSRPELCVTKMETPRSKIGLPSPNSDAPQVLRNNVKCPGSLNLPYNGKTSGLHVATNSPNKVPPKSPSKPCQPPSSSCRPGKHSDAPRYASKSEERSKIGGSKNKRNPTYGDSLPPPPPRPPTSDAPEEKVAPPAACSPQSAIEQKVMKGIEENMLKLQEQDRGAPPPEVKHKASNGIASWFGLKKSKLPALSRKTEGSKAKEWKINIPSVGKDSKVAARCKEGVEGLNISTLMEKAEGLRRALEEERAYVERAGRGHSCEVVMDPTQGQLAVMYRGGRSDNFMQQLLNRVDGKEVISVPQRRLSFDCKSSRPVFSQQSDGLSHTTSREDMQKASGVISNVTSDENLVDPAHSQHFAGSGASTYTLDSGIGTFPLPDYSSGAAGRSLSKMRAGAEHHASGSPGRVGRRARTLDREMGAQEESYQPHRQLIPTIQYASAGGVIHEDKEAHGPQMFTPRSKTWTFPNLKTPAGASDPVYLAVEEEEENVPYVSPFRGPNVKPGGPSVSRVADPGSLPVPALTGLSRRGKSRTPSVPEMNREAGLELLRERPEEALSPSRPQVLETPESLSDSLYDSLSSCGSQG